MKNKFIESPVTERALSHRRLVCGVGINDADYMTNMITAGGKQITCPYYQKWIDILQRTHSEKYFIRYPTYRGCSICDEWLVFSEFREWMESQDWKDKCLDKDVILPGNKVYSPETCAFVSQHVNLILTSKRRNNSGLPIGVSLYCGRYRAYMNFDKKLFYLGIYDTKEAAGESYNSRR